MQIRTFKRPNVLIIYTDQQRFDTMSCANENSPIHTKYMDSIASGGALLNKCFVQSPICGPSRMSFLTGRYCSSLGVGSNGVEFPKESAIPINRILSDYGYDTAQIGKIHFKPHAKRDAKDVYDDYGFDTFIVSDEPGCYDDPYTKWVEMIDDTQLAKVRTALPPAAFAYGKPEYSTVPRNTHEPYVFEGDDDLTHSAFVASETCRYLESRNKDKPFFCIAGFYAPHTPVNPPQSCLERVDETKIKLPIKVSEQNTMSELRKLKDDDWKKIIKYYLALTLHVDDCVGEILKTLEKTADMDNTIIIFTSDHGEYLGDYGRIQKGMPGEDCITNIPMIIKYPNAIKEICINQLVESVDIVPTILDYCGVQTPEYVQGKSLKKLLEGKTSEHKDCVLTEFFEPFGERKIAIRTNEYKYYCDDSGEELLFDLKQDENQLENVAGCEAYKNTLSQMRKVMIMKILNAAYQNREKEAEY